MVAVSALGDVLTGARARADWAILPPELLRELPAPRAAREAVVDPVRSTRGVREVVVGGPHGAPRDGAADDDPVGVAARLDVTDALVLRRVRPGEWLHVGGFGRPAGWAGTIALAESGAPGAHEPLLRRALAGDAPVRLLSSSPVPVAGPYSAGTAAVVRTGSDELVVLGSARRSGALLAASDDELRSAAALVVGARESDATARALREELALLQAVHALTTDLDRPVADLLAHAATVVADALGADLVLAWVGDERAATAGRLAGAVDGTGASAALRGAARSVVGAAGVTSARGPAAALPGLDGVASWLAAPLAVAGEGGVLVVHRGEGAAGPAPAGRPAGGHAQRVLSQLVATAGALLAVALAREEVERQLSDTRLQLSSDALTSAGSRHRWDAEVAAAQGLADAGVPVCVALLDLDDLKWVNDTHGHAAGDELLRTCADALRRCLRGSSDVVARVGGDEFGVLVPRVTDPASLESRLRRGVEESRTSLGIALRASVGVRLCAPGQRIDEVVEAADAAMFADKRARKAARGSAPRAASGARG